MLVSGAEGRWQRAEQNLLRGTRHNDATFINYIAAARAAHAQQEYQRRDEYITCKTTGF